MTEIDLNLLEPTLEKWTGKGRTGLLPCLHDAQELFGYIPETAASVIGISLGVPLADIYGVITFYSHFHAQPLSKAVIHVCNDPACAMAGADGYFKRMRESAEATADGVVIERAPCLGLCDIAPSFMVQADESQKLKMRSWRSMVSNTSRKHLTTVGGDERQLTKNCGRGRTTWLEEYRAVKGYEGYAKALLMTPTDVINVVKDSGLVGRGGAAFPTGVKWEGAAKAPGDVKFVVCNADEAEPGAFKDRVILEDDPHRIIEGLLITAYAIGASRGYIYIRGEYTEPYEIMHKALAEVVEAGLMQKLSSGRDQEFEIEIRRGAGAYICGEETALFESIEGKRGFPRLKPPFPVTHGLFGMPTVINNVETLSNIPTILKMGAEGYRQLGTEKSPGTKLFCLSGDVTRPGLYEVPFGVTFRHVLEDLGGGIRGGKKMQAALFGGAAGAFATEKDLDTRLTFEDLRTAGIPLGAGVITVFDENRDMRQIILRLAHFFAEESCGKCYPCQLGTKRQVEIVQRVADGKALPQDDRRLVEIGQTMTDASLCGLGQSAAMAVMSAMKLWPQYFLPDGKEA